MKHSIIILILALCFEISHAQSIDTLTSLDSCYIKQHAPSFPPSGSEIQIKNSDQGAYFSPLQLIRGKVPGLSIMQTMGNDPSQHLQVQLRGTSSFFLKTDVLYVVDGVPVENMSMVMPANIESIKVLRSISETTPYGVRGVNGVILINTKKALPGKLNVSYNNFFYFESQSKESEYLTPEEWRKVKEKWSDPMQFLQNYPISDPSYLIEHYEDLSNNIMEDYGSSTDWMNEIIQHKMSQSHNLNVSGTFKKTSYYFSLNYQHLNGLLKKNKNDVLNENLRISHLMLKDKLEMTVDLKNSNRKYSQYNTIPYTRRIFKMAEIYNPTKPLNYNDEDNPALRLDKTNDNRTANNFLAHGKLSYQITKGLKFNLGYIYQDIFDEDDYMTNIHSLLITNIKDYKKENAYMVGLNFMKNFGRNEVNFSLDATDRKNKVSSITKGVFGGESLSGFWTEFHSRFLSGSLSYNYAQRYFIQAYLTRETFYSANKDTSFYLPSVAVGWKISNETIFKNITWLNDFTLRASYGKNSRYPEVNKNFKDQFLNLQMERVEEINYGFDIEVFKRLNLSWDYFKRDMRNGVDGFVFNFNGVGPSTFPKVPRLQNKGWELDINAAPITSDQFQWSINLNYSQIITTAYSDYAVYGDATIHYLHNNDKVGTIYANKFAGFTEDGSRVTYFDKDGNITTDWSAQPVGNAIPDSYLGITNTWVYKNIDITVSLRGAFGFEILNNARYLTTDHVYNFSGRRINEDPRATISPNAISFTDYCIEKGDFVKIDNITIGYKLNLNKSIVRNARIYIACNNLATFTKFKGWDPEMPGLDWYSAGSYDHDPYLPARMFVVGCQISFR